MALLKSITLILVVALANPMCCCLILADPAPEALVEAKADPHACCKATAEAQSESAAPQGDRDCMHEEIKVTQQNDTPNDLTGLFSGLSHTEAYFLDSDSLDSIEARDAVSLKSQGTKRKTAPPGAYRSQEYCVCII